MPEEDPNAAEEVSPAPASNRALKNLDKLLDWIQLVHPVRVASGREDSAITDAFNFFPSVRALPYYTTIPGQSAVGVSTSARSDGLLSWIRGFEQHRAGSGVYPPRGSSTFIAWIQQTTHVEDLTRLTNDVRSRWRVIRPVLAAASDLESRLSKRHIGRIVIETDDADDEKKIFELINSAGTALTAVEILSARPDWGARVRNPADEISASSRRLLEQMGTGRKGATRDTRKWDVAASLLDRVDLTIVLGGQTDD